MNCSRFLGNPSSRCSSGRLRWNWNLVGRSGHTVSRERQLWPRKGFPGETGHYLSQESDAKGRRRGSGRKQETNLETHYSAETSHITEKYMAWLLWFREQFKNSMMGLRLIIITIKTMTKVPESSCPENYYTSSSWVPLALLLGWLWI